MSLEQSIINEAVRIGFAAAGIAPAGPAANFHIYKQWLDEGNAAGMEYLKRNLDIRMDTRKLLPEAKSIIVVAALYPSNANPGNGFSTYARGTDYHSLLKDKLGKLQAFIKNETRINSSRICVDSAPVLERELALTAGIGWRGKQGQIVNPEFGCCLVLGELFLDIELNPTQKLENQCGTCRKCLDACPTGAVSENGLINCRKCLSYLTIEHLSLIHI